MTDRAILALVLAASGCASAPVDRTTSPEEIVHATFSSDDDLKAWRITGGEWFVHKGAAVGTQVGDGFAYLTWPVYFGTISSVTIRGGIASPANHNFRVAVGNVSAILNWEMADQNLYRDQTWGDPRVVAPRALSRGDDHEIRFVEDDGVIRVLIDGRENWETRGHLRGTVTIYPAVGSTIRIRDVEIRGVPVPWIDVDGPSMRAP